MLIPVERLISSAASFLAFKLILVIKEIDQPIILSIFDIDFEKLTGNNVIISTALHLKEVF